MMDSLSTENQGIQPDPLYACGWFQDRVEIHSKTKQAVSMLPWMHHQQRIKEYNRTRCTRVVDRSKIVLRYTPKPKTSLRQAAMDAPDVWKRGNEISLKQQIVS